MDERFLIDPAELTLRLEHPPGRRALSFANHGGPFEAWRADCREKLAELLGLRAVEAAPVRELRRARHQGVEVRALLMDVSEALTVPAYLLVPGGDRRAEAAVMAIHGHNVGRAEAALGLRPGLYNGFAPELAKAGWLVLLPIHRGFGPLRDLAAGRTDRRLDYEQAMHFSYVTDAFVRGRTVVGENLQDLLRWEQWLGEAMSVRSFHAAGLSYGGDLALTYGALSERAGRVFASGSCASFEDHFCRCYNGPAHCVPGILEWMDRSDIAGLNAPRPLVLHFGERDTPCLEPGRENYAAAYTDHADDLFRETRQIYAAAGAPDNVRLLVTPGQGHAIDVIALKAFLAEEGP